MSKEAEALLDAVYEGVDFTGQSVDLDLMMSTLAKSGYRIVFDPPLDEEPASSQS